MSAERHFHSAETESADYSPRIGPVHFKVSQINGVNLPSVLIVGNFLAAVGGNFQVCEELALRLRQAGYHVIVTSNRKSRVLRLAEMLYTCLKQGSCCGVAQVDVFSGRSFIWAEAVCRALSCVGCPYVLTLHGGALPEFARGAGRRVRRLLNSAAAVTVPSGYLFERMLEYRQDLILLPNGLDFAAYQPHNERSVRPRLVWLRAFHDVYNPVMAVRVLARLKNEFPSIRLSMIGPDKADSSRDKTIAAAKLYGVEAHLKMCPSLPKAQVPRVLKTGDIFLNTSTVDNTPVSVLEAMASGVCVVSTDVGGIPYLLKSGQEALLVPANDDAAMAAAVRSLLKDQVLAEKIRIAALTKVRKFDWHVVLPQWQDLLASIAGRAYLEKFSATVPDSAKFI
jgi:glycosyltransferase involved in cell wall biosynthesis